MTVPAKLELGTESYSSSLVVLGTPAPRESLRAAGLSIAPVLAAMSNQASKFAAEGFLLVAKQLRFLSKEPN